MSKSLQDQLLKAGLVDDKKAKQANKAKRKQNKQQFKSKTVVVDENKAQAKKTMAEKAEKDRELNRQREEENTRKSIAAQIRQLIELNRQEKGKGDVAYNFVDHSDKKKIKKIFMTEEMQNQLVRGRLAIVKLDDGFELVPTPVAEKIRDRDPDAVVLVNEQAPEDDDDPYADYKIPDDLMW